MKKYEQIGNGFVSKNPKHTPNSTQPMFIGELTIDGDYVGGKDKVSIAMWRKVNYGKEGFSISATKTFEDKE